MKRLLMFVALTPVVGVAAACAGEHAPARTTYASEIETWRAERMERLKRPTGWFSLVGLHWLHDGDNTVGSNPASDVVFPEGLAPESVGVLTVADGRIRFQSTAGVAVKSGDEIITTLELRDDHDENGPTVLEVASLSWYVIKRGDRRAVRVKDREWATRRTFTGIESYPVDERWRVEARLERAEMPAFVSITDITGRTSSERTPGTLIFAIDGKTYELTPTAESDSDELFIIFGDETNGNDTYEAGRYVYADPADENGRVIIDFNRAYNPPCAFTPYATCPLPPPQNQLPLRVTAGEKAYRDGDH